MKGPLMWFLATFGAATVAFGLFILMTDPSPERWEGGWIGIFGVLMLSLPIYRLRRPLFWISETGIRHRGGAIAWDEVEGLTVQIGGGYASAILIPRDPSKKPRLSRVGEWGRRFTSWSIGRPAWGAIPFTGIPKSDLEYIAEIIERKEIPEIEARKWIRRILWFLGP